MTGGIASSRPFFSDVETVAQEIADVLRTGRLMLGSRLQQFEEAFAASVGCRHAVGVSSCTAALEIVLRYLRVAGGEVIVPTNTFIATANAVLYAGGTPVLTDIHPETLSLDLAGVEAAYSDRTRAVIAVHLAGFITPHLPEIRAWCQRRGLPLIEDCAHAHGATFDGAVAGALGFAGCFSFYPTKVMTTAGGGMITTSDDALNVYARKVRVHGRDDDGETMGELGNDWFLDEVRSVLGLAQLRQLPDLLARRRMVAETYLEGLQAMPGIQLLQPDARCRPSYYKFVALVEGNRAGLRLKAALRQRGIEAESLYWPACHAQPVYRRLFPARLGAYPVAERLLPRQVCLPLHAAMSPRDVQTVLEAVQAEWPRLQEERVHVDA